MPYSQQVTCFQIKWSAAIFKISAFTPYNYKTNVHKNIQFLKVKSEKLNKNRIYYGTKITALFAATYKMLHLTSPQVYWKECKGANSPLDCTLYSHLQLCCIITKWVQNVTFWPGSVLQPLGVKCKWLDGWLLASLTILSPQGGTKSKGGLVWRELLVRVHLLSYSATAKSQIPHACAHHIWTLGQP